MAVVQPTNEDFDELEVYIFQDANASTSLFEATVKGFVEVLRLAAEKCAMNKEVAAPWSNSQSDYG